MVLQSAGKGFQAGVDIKELAADPTHESLVKVNRGCYEAFGAVYDCEVPVIAAVHGFCLGGGVGLAGNADIVVASTTRRSASQRSIAARSASRRTWRVSFRSTSCAPCS